jgi:predicted lipid-binding transport protein (Tim44 family)
MGKPHNTQADQAGPMQAVARKLSGWIMMLCVGMGCLSITALYYGLLVVSSMLISIFLVAFTLYFFLRFWPEDPKPVVPAPSKTISASPKPRRPAMVSAMRKDAPPKARAVIALRDMVRRQESFQISQQGAEAFAKTIRFMLRS